MRPNIVLCGFMGTGKSTVGKLLAEKLGMRFIDMDDMLIQRESRSIPRIFQESGESYFRKLERDLVRELCKGENMAIATGGGVVLNPDNIADFAKTGLVVCLNASPEIILERTKHETNRPLLAVADPLARIKELLEKRQPYYSSISTQIDTSMLSPEQVCEEIFRLYNSFCKQPA